ncbi:MAG: undecaprenyl-diphosphate phosphatase [Treponema sp.]|nr:undecaprenyl-diphosphate phosphatase [Treponema sp.]
MTVFEAIVLGFIQGAAEFLPVSSSGHLKIAQTLFGLEEVPILFDIFLHLATLGAVVLYFRKKIWKLLKIFAGLFTRKPVSDEPLSEDILTGSETAGRKTILALIITTLVTGVIGVFTSKVVPDLSAKFVCGGFIITALLLIISQLAEKNPRKEKFLQRFRSVDENEAVSDSESNDVSNKKTKTVTVFQAIVVGIMQGFGTLPGISRSGSTIAGALYSGMDRNAAGEFSFLASIFAILGAFVLELKDIGEVSSNIGAAPVIAGCASAFAVGYISLTLLMKTIRKGKLAWFAAYLIPVGVLGIIFF